jgi:hypothetical protein
MKFVRIFAMLLALAVAVANAYTLVSLTWVDEGWTSTSDQAWSAIFAIIAAGAFGLGARYLTKAEDI